MRASTEPLAMNFRHGTARRPSQREASYRVALQQCVDPSSILICVRYAQAKVQFVYRERTTFLDDIELMYRNAEKFNGPASDITRAAEVIAREIKEEVRASQC